MKTPIRILGIQFRKNQKAIALEQGSIRRELGDDVMVDFVSAVDESIDWTSDAFLKSYYGVVLGGSGEFDFDGGRTSEDPARTISQDILDRLSPFLTKLFDSKTPVLGICYGHQLIGAFSGVRVHSDPVQKKTKTHEVSIAAGHEDDPIFLGVSPTFTAHYGHKDVLADLPSQAVLIASGGESCKVSGLKYGDWVYTFQFHPELSFSDMQERIAESPEYLPPGVAIENVFTETPEANKILRNFVSIITA